MVKAQIVLVGLGTRTDFRPIVGKQERGSYAQFNACASALRQARELIDRWPALSCLLPELSLPVVHRLPYSPKASENQGVHIHNEHGWNHAFSSDEKLVSAKKLQTPTSPWEPNKSSCKFGCHTFNA